MARQLSGDNAGAAVVLDEWLATVEATNDAWLGYALAKRSLWAIAGGDWEASPQKTWRGGEVLAAERNGKKDFVNATIFAGLARLAVRDRD